ncbi:flagellar biosynthesis protein FlhB [Kineothrix sp. MSJ-39]|uniref:flagellar biosynthesis protein FlhB n=1 Tax=Kineothrix sp. MSJ-39 TaxID=2841533 RepID=UPI001C102490|nr:flagellar biosynthesis protein FlhB [Kineothrix sp. MSJ-39]MBU5429333.1 flagellar biosynthesis protein FlhB [Kineothrix sp. MSJ-39]
MTELRLQFFAKEGPGGEKTEKPTAKKLEDARKEGQVAKSREISNALTMIGLFILLKVSLSFLGNQFLGSFEDSYNHIPELIKLTDGKIRSGDFSVLLLHMLFRMLLGMAPFLAVGFVLAFLADFLQVKWKVTTKPLQPKFSKLNPVNGFKRIFSVNSLMELLKSVLKIGLISYVVYTTIKDKLQVIYLLFHMTLWQGIATAADIAISIGLKVSIVYVIIAVLDFAYQKHKFNTDQMMTKQEIKDEYKNAEGDPAVKGKQRQRMQEASRRRMMQDIPKADVVITNPTHFAVAIQYDTKVAAAPVVLAKGEDHLAAKIKEVARENKVEIVENKPLARMLYYNVDIGQQVPPELYQAVAEVLAMVYHMQGKI